MNTLTKRQQEYFDYMVSFFKENDQFPPVAVMAEGMGVTNKAVEEAQQRLARAGVIERNVVGKWRLAR